jgi:glycine cleavage system regulatory protein
VTGSLPWQVRTQSSPRSAASSRSSCWFPVRRATSTARGQRAEEGRPYLLETVSWDSPGIVHTVTAVLCRNGVNRESLETDTAPAPWTGAPMFRMRAHVVVGPRVEVVKLKDDLAHLEAGQDLDVRFRPVFPVPERG